MKNSGIKKIPRTRYLEKMVREDLNEKMVFVGGPRIWRFSGTADQGE